MKFLKYTGLYLVITAIGNNVLKMAEAGKIWTAFFMWERFFGICQACGEKILDKLSSL